MKYKLILEKNFYADTYGFYCKSIHRVGEDLFYHQNPKAVWTFNLKIARYMRFLLLQKYRLELNNLTLRNVKIHEISS